MSPKRLLLTIPALLLVAGCVQAGAQAPAPSNATPSAAAPSAAPIDGDATPVSLRSSSGFAADGVVACAVSTYSDQVRGIAVIAHASLLPHYVPLTGDEPEIKSDQAALVVLYTGTIRLPLRGAAAYDDVNGATCMYSNGRPTWFLTGPWEDSLGNKGTPLPAVMMDRGLPALVP